MFVTKLNADRLARWRTRPSSAARRSTTGRASRSTPRGNAYALGFSSSTDFPTTPGAFDTTRERRLRRHAHEAQPGRVGARLLHVPRRAGLRRRQRRRGRRRRQRLRHAAAPGRPTSRPRPGAFDTTPDGSDAFVTKFNAGRVRARLLDGRSAARRATRPMASCSTRPATPGSPGARPRRTSPSSADAADATFNGGAADAFIAELNAAGSALPFATFLGGSQSETGDGHRPRLGRQPLRHRHHLLDGLPGDGRRVRHDLQRRPVDLLGRRLRDEGRRSTQAITPPAPPPVPRPRHAGRRPTHRPRRSRSRSTGTTSPARRRTRSRSTTRARSPRRWSAMSP